MIIYKATNKINGKSYIGQTIYTLEKRKSQHICESSNNNSGAAFHQAIRKYGEENFTQGVIDDTAKDVDELNQLEQKYIKEYDMTMSGMNKLYDDHTKEKMRKNHADFSSENHPLYGKRGKDSPNYGKKRSLEQRKNMSDGQLSRTDIYFRWENGTPPHVE